MFLSIQAYSFKTWTNVWSTLYSLFYLLILLFFLIFIPIYVGWNRKKFFRLWAYIGDSFMEKYFAFFGEVKNTKWSALFFYFFFFLWRLIYAATIIWVRKSMLGSCIIFLVTSVLMFLYFLIFWPYKNCLLNFLNIINETLVVINSATFFLFWENPNPLVSFYAGWVLIFLLVAIVSFNIFIMFFLKFLSLISLIKFACKKLIELSKKRKVEVKEW